MNRPLVFAIVGLIWLTTGLSARAQDLGITGANLLRLDEGREVDPQKLGDFPDNRTGRSFFENQLRLNITYGALCLGGRFLYFRPSDVDTRFFGVDNETGLDKRYLEAHVQPLAVRVGHFAEVFDHGLALSLFEDREIYFDSELDGVRLCLAEGPIAFTALKGRSTARPGFVVFEEGVTGLHGEVTPMAGWKVGGSFVHLDSTDYPEADLPAVSGLMTMGPVQVSGEFAWKETDVGSECIHGHAAYLAMTADYQAYTLLVNYKDYRYRGWTPFQNPPLVSREIGPRLLQYREPHVFYPEDDVGYQVELSGRPADELYAVVHFNHSSHHALNQKGIARPTFQERDFPYWEFFSAIENTWPSDARLECEAGLSEEAQAHFWFKKYWMAADFAMPFGEAGELQFGGEMLVVRDKRKDETFTDELVAIGWDNGGNLSTELRLQLTDDEALRKQEGDLWPSAEVGYYFGKGCHRVIVFWGRERGGLRCSNGFCRRVQPFEGFRFTLESSL